MASALLSCIGPRMAARHGGLGLVASCVRSKLLKDVTRIVVKLGTGVLTDSRKQPDLAQMEQLVAQMAQQRQAGKELVLVSSGAVGAGMGALGFTKRPGELEELQACAAVGQSRLMATYEKLFAAYDLPVAQILLTHDDLEHHERHLNARNTLVTLLRHGVIPIINENVEDWPTPIIGLSIGDAANMRRIHEELRRAGIIVPYFAAYSAAGPEGGLRIAVFATHTGEMLDGGCWRSCGGFCKRRSTWRGTRLPVGGDGGTNSAPSPLAPG